MDYRDWGYDSRGPRERRSADEVRPQSWDYTGESSDLERPSGAQWAADAGGAGGYPSYSSDSYSSGSYSSGSHSSGSYSSDSYSSGSYSSGSYSSGSVYRGRRRQQDDAMAEDRPFGRRSARTRWQQGEDESTGTFSRYEEPDDRSGRHSSGWSPEVAPTSGWTPSAAPTSGWVGAASSGEWTREAYTGEWTRGDFTGEWHRDTGEPIRPSRSDGPRHGDSGGGRRRAAPGRLELPAGPSGYASQPAGYDERPPAPPRDTFTDTGEWSAPSGEPPASRPQRPDWAVGLDPSTTGRKRRSWQDQTEARWPSTRSGGDRVEEPSGSWSSSAPVSGLSGASGWSGRAEAGRGEEPATRWSDPRAQQPGARLSEDDPRWVGIPSSAPRSPAIAFPDEPDPDYDDRTGARGTPTTFRGDDWRSGPERPAPSGYGDDAPTTYRATAAPRARAEVSTTDWVPPTAAPGTERGLAEAPTRAAGASDWRAPATFAGAERGVAQAPGRASAPAADWRPPTADAGRRRGLGAAVRRVSTPDELEDEFTRAPGGVLAAVVATLAWYAVPLLLFAAYTLFQGEESQALGSLSGGLTRFAAALAVSLIVAILLRWVSSTWRAVSVGLAAAVVGGGLSTVLLSAISGQPLGG